MSWGEAVRLTRILSADPSTQVAASIAGWNHPVSREVLVLMDQYDLAHAIGAAGSKHKPKPYPRPWPTEGEKRRTAKPDADVTQEEILAALRAAGHTAALPSPN